MTAQYIKSVVKTVPDYPKPGILFRDVTSVLEDHKAFSSCIALLLEEFQDMGFNKVAGTEARGFLFGAPLAIEMGIGFVPVIHKDAIQPGDKVLLIDDLLATGGTIEASAKLIRTLGGTIEHAGFVIGLPELGGREKLTAMGIKSFTLCEFDGE